MLLKYVPGGLRATVVDVRSREEFELGHAANAVNIPWDLHLYYLKELQELSKPLVFVCEEGWRAGVVVFSLRNIGFTEVYNLGRWIDIDRERAELVRSPAA